MVGENFYSSNPAELLSSAIGISQGAAIIIIVIIGIWSLIWKGLALWKAARKTHKAWFIVILLLNTIGILEILYLYVFSNIKFDEEKRPARKKK